MLCLSRKLNEEIVIDGRIWITVIEVRGDKVRLGISAPDDMRIDRAEVHLRAQQEGWDRTLPCDQHTREAA